MKSPLSVVKEKFGDKSKLIATVEKFTGEDLWVSRTNKDKGLAHVSNAKLLRLHDTFSAVKERFGSRAKLIDAILDIEKRAKDEGFRHRLEAFPVPRLWDMLKSAERRTKAAAAPAPKEAMKAKAKVKAAASRKSGVAGGAGSKSAKTKATSKAKRR
jgi:hypothetical protein